VNPLATGPVIELGPGTGAVTEALVEHGIEPSRLVLVEFNRLLPLVALALSGRNRNAG
jgi:phosphatidylethanolamine/phosphatidyl-N-methylethanolamine N-methyltransferase